MLINPTGSDFDWSPRLRPRRSSPASSQASSEAKLEMHARMLKSTANIGYRPCWTTLQSWIFAKAPPLPWTGITGFVTTIVGVCCNRINSYQNSKPVALFSVVNYLLATIFSSLGNHKLPSTKNSYIKGCPVKWNLTEINYCFLES